jgi:aminoglycoside/choline kinase family phosphotransferase
MLQKKEEVAQLFMSHFGTQPIEIQALPASGSNRYYYRLNHEGISAIATYNPDRSENEAFIYITGQLKKAGVNVPAILAIDLDRDLYLQEDLGDITLYDFIESARAAGNTDYLKYYRAAIQQMPAIQYFAGKNFDYTKCFPREAFDIQSIHWDLNYFKYYYLKLAYIPFHEQKLEEDFRKLAEFLLGAPSDFFLFRDFQSRNIMIKDEALYFIDYQGGRRGALQYDLASLLYDAKANLSVSERVVLLDHYVDTCSEYGYFDRELFLKYFPAFVLIRQLQAFGAYGYRGFFEKKTFFLKSIPFGIRNIKYWLDEMVPGIHIPHLVQVLNQMTEQYENTVPESVPGKLNVRISSFSYKKKLPEDYSGNGGGFTFDCRNLPNPGRFDEFKSKTGRDTGVIAYLEKQEEVGKFLEHARELVSGAVKNYTGRGFEHLMVSFGCTGGQHRSVYCADRMYDWFSSDPKISVTLKHLEL